MRDWLRSNRLGLLSLVALVPALLVVLVAIPAAQRAEFSPQVEEVAAGDSATAGGLTYRVRVAAEFTAEGDGLAIPDGTSLVAAVVDVAIADESEFAEFCEISLGDQLGADRRVWSQALGLERYGYQRGADFADTCDARPSADYSLELVFLTPSDVIGTAAVDIAVRTGDRLETLRLELPPEA